MTIIDYKKGGLTGNKLGLEMVYKKSGPIGKKLGLEMENGELKAPQCRVSDVQFLNFPKVTINGLHFTNCTFVSCEGLALNQCVLLDCNFREIGEIVADECQFTQCEFADLHTDINPLLEIWDTTLRCCSFRNIVVQDETYLCDANPGSRVENCKFEKCWTDRDDYELFICEETTGGFFKRKKQYNILDDVSERNALQGCNLLDD